MKPTIFTNKRTRLLCMVLLLGMLMGVSSCAATPGEGEETTVEIPEIEQPDAALLEQIEQDYHAYSHIGEEHKPETIGCYYGTYNGCVVFMFGRIVVISAQIFRIAGCPFKFSAADPIYVWKDGEFFMLGEAYDQALLTKEQIQTIAAIHENHAYVRTGR